MRHNVPPPPLRDITVGHFSLHQAYTCYREEGTQDWQLLIHHKGKGVFHHQQGDLFMEGLECVLLPPRIAHDYGLPEEGGHWAAYWAHFIPRPHWLSFLQWNEVRDGLFYFKIPNQELYDMIINLIQEAIDLVQEEVAFSEQLAMNRLEEILIRIARVQQDLEHSGLDQRIVGAVRYIQANYSRSITLPILAARASISEAAFCRLFKKEMGKSPINYVEHIRITHACHFLSTTTHSIKDITFLLGFSSKSHFCARFKKYNNMTPLEYRRNALPLDNSLEA
ncbi:helix-turn-helix domain-containing protein [Lentisphaera profundi]|uniref:Helix-turn-helix domain-containing protein n=1 Tax=Lentisphaera profundi TaxID=1658616 RepID=A0ABY7VSP8_9BACT|nr:helix-turn-helix domain-containing protein [Lentisphaera profundi]WDE95799.1 helix-turn-helix domain-containing protein [Lentisphaera profundi]